MQAEGKNGEEYHFALPEITTVIFKASSWKTRRAAKSPPSDSRHVDAQLGNKQQVARAQKPKARSRTRRSGTRRGISIRLSWLQR